MGDEYTVKEIVTEIRDDLKDHITDSEAYKRETDERLSRRPTRADMYRFVSTILVIVGTGVGVAVAIV